MTPRRHIAVSITLLCGLLCASLNCNRPSPTQTQPSSPPPTTQPASSATALKDWVAHPSVDPAEKNVPAPRIVSAAPNVTEICCALGLRDALVGRTRYCDYPPGIESVTSIGALIDVNVEALLELHPDLILIAGTSRAQMERFTSLGLRVESVPDFRVEDLFVAIRLIGDLTARPKTADTLCANIEADLDRVTQSHRDFHRRRILLCTAPLTDPPRPPLVAGPGSFYDDLLRRARLENIAPETQMPFAPLSLEFIIRADPDVIIELAPDDAQRPHGDADALQAWSNLGELKSVADHRVHVLIGNRYFLLGPRLPTTYEALCQSAATP